MLYLSLDTHPQVVYFFIQTRGGALIYIKLSVYMHACVCLYMKHIYNSTNVRSYVYYVCMYIYNMLCMYVIINRTGMSLFITTRSC